jgi:hypothetical protein
MTMTRTTTSNAPNRYRSGFQSVCFASLAIKHCLIAMFLILMTVPVFAKELHGTLRGASADFSGLAAVKTRLAVPWAQPVINWAQTTAKIEPDSSITPRTVPESDSTVTIDPPGFEDYVRRAMETGPTNRSAVEIRLEAGDTSHTLSVSAIAPPYAFEKNPENDDQPFHGPLYRFEPVSELNTERSFDLAPANPVPSATTGDLTSFAPEHSRMGFSIPVHDRRGVSQSASLRDQPSPRHAAVIASKSVLDRSPISITPLRVTMPDFKLTPFQKLSSDSILQFPQFATDILGGVPLRYPDLGKFYFNGIYVPVNRPFSENLWLTAGLVRAKLLEFHAWLNAVLPRATVRSTGVAQYVPPVDDGPDCNTLRACWTARLSSRPFPASRHGSDSSPPGNGPYFAGS